MSTHAAHVSAAMDARDVEPSTDTTSRDPQRWTPTPDMGFDLAVLVAESGLAISKATRGLRHRERLQPDGLVEQLSGLVERMAGDAVSDIEAFAADAALVLGATAGWLRGHTDDRRLIDRLDAMRRTLTAATTSPARHRG